ncbi:hypothetical protein FHW16_000921 [Phyllobacterium myrsinacearum]|uniref:Uncharacterized protein n=1 Tax=Phyllobacterium myrsinacearum TaxID=28101 RepID=A0A839EER6_9HYPH|nr:hypothetical protein [Phyllobacterium myrsinacearum]
MREGVGCRELHFPIMSFLNLSKTMLIAKVAEPSSLQSSLSLMVSLSNHAQSKCQSFKIRCNSYQLLLGIKSM